MKNKRFIITGGSGFIGTNVVNDLLENDYDFINLDIVKPNNPKHVKYWKKVSLLDINSLKDIFNKFKPTHILHLASILGGENITSKELNENIVCLKNIITCINSIETVENFLFTSSLLVCENGYIPKNNLDFCPPNEYGNSKVECEKIIHSAELNCNWVIVRPTAIWGPWFKESSKRFFQVIDKNMYFHIGYENRNKTACFVGNASFMILKLATSEYVNKGTYYLRDYPSYSIRNWANSIQQHLGVKRIISLPIFLIKIVAVFGDLIQFLLKIDFPLTSFRLKNMQVDSKYPVENTKEVCGELPYNLDTSVLKTLEWMSDNKLIKNQPKKL